MRGQRSDARWLTYLFVRCVPCFHGVRLDELQDLQLVRLALLDQVSLAELPSAEHSHGRVVAKGLLLILSVASVVCRGLGGARAIPRFELSEDASEGSADRHLLDFLVF